MYLRSRNVHGPDMKCTRKERPTRPRAPAFRAGSSLLWALAQRSAPRAHKGGRAVTLRPPRGLWPRKVLPAPTRNRLPGGIKLALGPGPGKPSPRPRRWARRDFEAAAWALAQRSASRAHAHPSSGRDQACSGPWPREVLPAPASRVEQACSFPSDAPRGPWPAETRPAPAGRNLCLLRDWAV